MSNELWPEEKAAPHGRDENGEPKTPFGVNRDGSPRKSNRGARPGQRGNAGARGSRPRARTAVGNKTDQNRKDALVGLVDMLITTPLAGLSASPQIASRIGEKHATALAGDAVIVDQFAPPLADSLIMLSQTKPGALAWLDTMEQKAPYVMLANVGLQLAKTVAENHMNPNPQLAQAGRLRAQIKAEQMAAAIRAEAEAMGIPTDLGSSDRSRFSDDEPTVPIPQPV